jgi:hypothetical protein
MSGYLGNVFERVALFMESVSGNSADVSSSLSGWVW